MANKYGDNFESEQKAIQSKLETYQNKIISHKKSQSALSLYENLESNYNIHQETPQQVGLKKTFKSGLRLQQSLRPEDSRTDSFDFT